MLSVYTYVPLNCMLTYASRFHPLLLPLQLPYFIQIRFPPLHYAALGGHTKTVMELVRLGAKVDEQDMVRPEISLLSDWLSIRQWLV